MINAFYMIMTKGTITIYINSDISKVPSGGNLPSNNLLGKELYLKIKFSFQM